MRTTLDIAIDVLRVAKVRARREKKTIGQVISELARSSLTASPGAPAARTSKAPHEFRPFPQRGGIVTNEIINRLRNGDIH